MNTFRAQAATWRSTSRPLKPFINPPEQLTTLLGLLEKEVISSLNDQELRISAQIQELLVRSSGAPQPIGVAVADNEPDFQALPAEWVFHSAKLSVNR
ncbi:hypothetical protein [Hyphobacterium sp.]|uniref:hypothetical protein n=1 Tax=Hyphobacterium sp. TaxID=2004662 RepID=UPI003748E72C